MAPMEMDGCCNLQKPAPNPIATQDYIPSGSAVTMPESDAIGWTMQLAEYKKVSSVVS